MSKKRCPFIPSSSPTTYCYQEECEHWNKEHKECRLKTDAILNIEMDFEHYKDTVREIVREILEVTNGKR